MNYRDAKRLVCRRLAAEIERYVDTALFDDVDDADQPRIDRALEEIADEFLRRSEDRNAKP